MQVILRWQMFIFAVSECRAAVYICISTSRAELIPDMHKLGWALFLCEMRKETTEMEKVVISHFLISAA